MRDAAAAFHLATSSTVLFGGWPALSDTWLYDGTTWTLAAPATVPAGRREFAMAHDFARNRVVMFGGLGASGTLGDTWEWDGSNWNPIATATTPPARFGHVMAYDAARGVTVMFGGSSRANFPAELRDTWEFDGVNWTQTSNSAGPFESLECSMAYDLARGVCVVTGGTSFFGAPDQSTWEYDGVNWNNVTGTVGPGPSATPGLGVTLAKMVYDANLGACVLYGGRTPNGTFSTDTWTFDGAAWTVVASSTPSSRTRFVMAMDLARNVPVLYGGVTGNFQTTFDETWEFSAGVAASFTNFGTGCLGSAGVPSLSATGGGLPVAGQSFSVDITNLPAASSATSLMLSLSAQAVALDLSLIGMTGCTLDVGTPLAVLPVPAAGGIAQWALPLPSDPFWLGQSLYYQAFTVDVGANPLGLTSSIAAEAVIGN